MVPGSDNLLNVNVLLMSLPKHSFSFEVEGTNTAGDLGAAASLSFTNRNLFRGSEQLTIKLRGAYESISNLPGYTGDTYLEYGLEANLDFPEFLMPFMSQDLQRRSQATSRFSFKVNAQRRPEFQKTIFSAGWSYRWGETWQQTHQLDSPIAPFYADRLFRDLTAVCAKAPVSVHLAEYPKCNDALVDKASAYGEGYGDVGGYALN